MGNKLPEYSFRSGFLRFTEQQRQWTIGVRHGFCFPYIRNCIREVQAFRKHFGTKNNSQSLGIQVFNNGRKALVVPTLNPIDCSDYWHWIFLTSASALMPFSLPLLAPQSHKILSQFCFSFKASLNLVFIVFCIIFISVVTNGCDQSHALISPEF